MKLRKIVSLVLATAMLLTMMPFAVVAEDGTEADLTISDVAGLKEFAKSVNGGNTYKGKLVVLENDIDLLNAATDDIVAIGTKDNPFMGTFDGGNHTISNFTIWNDSADYVGLFGYIENPAVVKNVTVEDPFIVGRSNVGGIVGCAFTGKVENCHVTGEIDIEGYYKVGGIVGSGYASISGCSVIGDEDFDYNTISATYSDEGYEGDNVGGIVGFLGEGSITIADCTVENVSIEGTRKVGGIVGSAFQNNIITDCSVSDITVTTNADADYAADNASSMGIGGIVGLTSSTYEGGTITNCSVSDVSFGNENNVTVSAGAITGGHRGTDAPVAPESTTIVNNTVGTVSGTTTNTTINTYGIVEVGTFEELVAALAKGGDIKLTADITTDKAIVTTGVTAAIDLNGKTLKIGAGDNKFNDETNLTIKNGAINIDGVVVKGNAIFCLDEYEETLVTTLTLENVDLTGKNYSSAYGVFYIGDSSVLNVKDGEWTLTNDLHTAGGVFKADDAKATLNIDGTEMTLHNVRRVVTYANTTIENAAIAISGDEDGVDAEMEHGFNRSPLTVENSTITMENLVGRGITAEKGAVAISDNSTVTMVNCQEATIDVRAGQTVTVDSTSTVTVDAEPTITSGSIEGDVTVIAGTVTPAYTKEVDGYVRVWGEGTATASESFVLELYADDTLIATTELNNVDDIIDGDVYVTWNFYYPSSNDNYWTTTWEEGHPNSAAQPTKVVLYADGVKVAENVAKMSAPDNVSPVEWSKLGGVKLADTDAVAKIGNDNYTTLAKAIEEAKAGDVVIELLADATLDYNAREAYGTADTTSITINGNGHTLTLNQKDSDWASLGMANAEAKLVLNDMTIEKTGYGDTDGTWNTHAIIFKAPLEMTDVTVNNSIAVEAGATLNNVTINEANGYYGLWIDGNGQTVTVNGGAINATNDSRGIKIADEYVDEPVSVTLSITDTKFNTAKKAAVLVSSKAGAAVTAENVDITKVAADNDNLVWVDEEWAAYFGNVSANGGTVAQENIKNFVASIVTDDKVEGYYTTLADAIAAMNTDGSSTTIKLLCDVEMGDIKVAGAGDIILTADKPVTVKQTAQASDFDFVNEDGIAIKGVTIAENVTVEVYDNSSGVYLYYGPSLKLDGTITGGQNWGALYLCQGEHTVSENGKIGVGRVQLGYTEITVNGEIDTNYLLVEGSTFTAAGATACANVIYDNNNGAQRWGASNFNIKNGSDVTTTSLTLSYADTELTIDTSSKLTATTITGAGKIIIDAANYVSGSASPIIGNASTFTGTVTVINNNKVTAEIDKDGNIVLTEVAAPSADLIYAGYVGTSGEAGTASYRENIQVDLYNVYAEESLVVELWCGDTKLSTTTLRQTDRDDETVKLYPVEGSSTANIVVNGRLAGSWDTVWHVAPSTAYIPDTIKAYADGVLTDTWNGGFINDTELEEYKALTGVAKADDETIVDGLVMLDPIVYYEPIITFDSKADLYRVAMIAEMDGTLYTEWYKNKDICSFGFKVRVGDKTQTFEHSADPYGYVEIEGTRYDPSSEEVWAMLAEVLAFGTEYAGKDITIQAYMVRADSSIVYSEPVNAKFVATR